MPMFAYTARDMSGKQVTGTVEANAEKAFAEGILKYADHAIESSKVKAFAKRLSWENYIVRLLN